jgi:hypothetical protein
MRLSSAALAREKPETGERPLVVKTKRESPRLRQRRGDLDRERRQVHFMRAIVFCLLARDRPSPLFEVDFGLLQRSDFVASLRGQQE